MILWLCNRYVQSLCLGTVSSRLVAQTGPRLKHRACKHPQHSWFFRRSLAHAERVGLTVCPHAMLHSHPQSGLLLTLDEGSTSVLLPLAAEVPVSALGRHFPHRFSDGCHSKSPLHYCLLSEFRIALNLHSQLSCHYVINLFGSVMNTKVTSKWN